MTEIVSHEFAGDDNKTMKMVGFIFGLVCFSIFMIFDTHSHGPDGEHVHHAL